MNTDSPALNPFPGLRPFRQDEDYLFFGREDQTLELRQRLGGQRLVAVVGTSGSGKSSLVRCGLLSELQGGKMLQAGTQWQIAVTHPGGDPLHLLAESLLDADLYDRDEEEIRERLLATLGRSHFGLIEAVRQAGLPAGTNFLLVVDQFEEIFRFNEAGASQREIAAEFICLLLEAIQQKDVPIYVVLTMRSDFIGDCAQFEGLAEAVNRGEFLIPRLTREQYKRVIEGPIKVAGGQLTPRLLQRLLNDLGEQEDQLPCLQHALMRMWDHRTRSSRGNEALTFKSDIRHQTSDIGMSLLTSAAKEEPLLDLEDYQRVGRMSQALSIHADEIHESLANDRQRELCARLFKALTVQESDSRGIRRPQRLKRLAQITDVPAAELGPILDAYRAHGVTFLMPSPEIALHDQTVIDISHESLMRVWGRLRHWVEEEAQSVGIFQRLSESAALHQQRKAGLYRDPELGIALAWRDTAKPNADWADQYGGHFVDALEYLNQSREAAEREETEREAARQRELEQAKALAETAQLRVAEQQRYAGRLRWLVRGMGLVAMLALGAMVLALIARRDAQKNREMAEQNESRATASATEAREQAAKANAEKLRADENAEKFRGQAYKVQLFRAQAALEQNGGLTQEYLNDCDPGLRRWEWDRLGFLADSSSSRITAHSNSVSTVGLNRDGTRMVTASGADNLIKVWDLPTRKTIRELPGHATSYREGRDPWLGAGITPDGSRVISRSPNRIKVWDVETADVIKELEEQDSFNDVALSPDGKQLAIASGNGSIGLWDLTTWKLVKWQVSSNWIENVCFSADGHSIACDGSQGFSFVVETTSGKVIRKFRNESRWLTSLALSPDGKQLATANWGGGVTVYDLASEQSVKSLPTLTTFGGIVRFSPNGQFLIGGGGSIIEIWDAIQFEKRGSLRGHKANVSTFCFGPDGSTLVAGNDDGEVRFWDFPGRPDQLSLLGHRGNLREVAFSPDGQRLVSGGADNTARVWDTRTGQELLTFRGHKGFVTAVAWSPDGKRIVSGDNDQYQIQVWDPNTGRVEQVIGAAQGGHTNGVWWVNFNPDGTVLVSGSADKTVRLWDTATWKRLKVLEGFQSQVEGAVFSPDGKWIATSGSGNSGKVQVWDWRSGQVVQEFQGPKERHRSTVFSPDGKRVAVGTWLGKVVIWNLGTGKALQCEQQASSVNSVAFSPDGARAFSGQANGFINVWDARTGDGLFSFNGNQGTIWCVKPSPDGKTLATTGDLGIIQLWETSKIASETVRRRALVDAARRVVDERFESLKTPEKVLTAIREDKALSDGVREVALQIATARDVR